ncbi:ribonuclease H2, subunit B [Trichoderma sp. SZMC 28014]
MARTRATKPSTAASATESDSTKSKSTITLVSHAGEAPKVFILPSKATPDARIVTLPNPRSSQPSRYLACPETGIYEFTKVATPKSVPRSWLIETAPNSNGTKTGDQGAKPSAQVTMGSELFVATAIDPLFLVLPALADAKASKGSDEVKRLFLSSDDHLDKLPQDNSHLSEIMRWETTRRLIESRMGAVCDTVEAGDESMFRLNEKKLLDVIFQKAKRMSESGLPLSMEDKFIKKVLQAPMMHRVVRTGESQLSGNNNADSASSTPQTELATSQSTTSTTESSDTSVSQASTAATSVAEEPTEETFASSLQASPEVVEQQRLKVAFDFICSSYVAPLLADNLQKSFSGVGGLKDFSLLNDYIASLEKLRSETMAVRAQDYGRKRNQDELEDEARMEKKRKMEEEKKKKASESRGVRDLKKVNTSGMKKLSHFFQKK